jgi:hypothetical protein
MAFVPLSQAAERKPMIFCSGCGSDQIRRVARNGFLQTKVFPFFGLYPWECPMCRKIFLKKDRGTRIRRKHRKSSNVKVD